MAWYNRELTIGDLMNIDDGRINRSKNLKVKLDSITNVLKEESWLDKLFKLFRRGPKYIFYKVLKYKVKSDSGNEYTVFIKVSPSFNERRFMANKVQVFCSCPDFMYRAAYELNKTGNLFLNKSTTDHLGIALTTPPTRINPTPICKHIYAVMDDFIKNYRKYGLVH